MSEEKTENDGMKIEIRFHDDRADVFDMKTFGTITPYQLLLLASYLEFEGKYALSKIKEIEENKIMQQMQEQAKIATLKDNILRPQ